MLRKIALALAVCSLALSYANGAHAARSRLVRECQFDKDALRNDRMRVSEDSVQVFLVNAAGKVTDQYFVPLMGTYSLRQISCANHDQDAKDEILISRTRTGKVIKAIQADKPKTPSACRSVRGWPSGFIYKTVGSGHFTDCRRNTIGLIMTRGTAGPFPGSINLYSENGIKLGSVGKYWGNDPSVYAARYYSCITGGAPTQNGAGLASRARQVSGSTKVYFERAGECYGPVEANRCIGSKQC